MELIKAINGIDPKKIAALVTDNPTVMQALRNKFVATQGFKHVQPVR